MADVAEDHDHVGIVCGERGYRVLELPPHTCAAFASSSARSCSYWAASGDLRCHSKMFCSRVGHPYPLIVRATTARAEPAGPLSAPLRASTSWPATSRTSQPKAASRWAGLRIGSDRTCELLKSKSTVKLESSRLQATMMASQVLPSLASPSPIRVNTRRGLPATLNASAMPTASPMPWPSDPVDASTPATLRRSGWQPYFERYAPNERVSSTGK